MTLFLRLLEVGVDEKAAALKEAARGDGARVFDVEPSGFAQVPGSPFAYWVSNATISAFRTVPALASERRFVKQGLVTADDFRFLRSWWEFAGGCNRERWFGFAKGGAYSPFYMDIGLVVGYSRGDQVGLQAIGRYGRGATYYSHPGLTWPLRTDGLSFRLMPKDCIFSHKGPAAFVEGDAPTDLLALCAILNSSPFGYLVSVQLARTELAQSYEVGLIQQTPVPDLDATTTSQLSTLARRAWSLKRTLDTVHETSHAFLLPAALRARLGAFDPPAIEAELTQLQSQIDDLAFQLYGIDGEDRAEIERWAHKGQPVASADAAPPDADANPGDDAAPDDEAEADEPDDAASGSERDSLLSWCVGVAFGRFDVRLATGERAAAPEPEPFDALPARSPGMLPDDSAARAILVDDAGHKDDLGRAVAAVLERIAVPTPEDLRPWLARDFFSLHLKAYSKSRRKAPIYWQLATPSASYSVWLYLHAFDKDTLRDALRDHVLPRLRHEERELERLRGEFGASPGAAQRKQLARLDAFTDELRAFVDDLKRVEPLWEPDLDDGVLINFAPLFRLVPQHKAWQKELRATWEALCKGKYDWSHLAMRLWPERVLPQCATDRSLAIAHSGPKDRPDLEAIFWEEVDKDKWQPRKTPTRPVAELIAERTSPAVKAALATLAVTAPARPAARRRGKKGSSNA